MKSKCHNAKVRVVDYDMFGFYLEYICTKCNKPCKVKNESKQEKRKINS